MAMSNGVTGGNFTTLADLQASKPRAGTIVSITIDGVYTVYSVGVQDLGGGISVNGLFANPVTTPSDVNHLWMGGLDIWQRASSFASGTERRACADGWSMTRSDFTAGCFVSNTLVGARLSRNAGDANESDLVMVANLTQNETKPLVGRDVFFGFDYLKSIDYTGLNLTVSVNYSIEQEQSIVNADGSYTSGNEQAFSVIVTPETSVKSFDGVVSIPSNATQVSVVVSVEFYGTAPPTTPTSGDYVELSDFVVSRVRRSDTTKRSFDEALNLAYGRYKTSYPYGSGGLGANNRNGELQAVAIDTSSVSVLNSVRFNPAFNMVAPPTVYAFAPGDGQDLEIWDVDSEVSILAMIEGISQNGATIKNNAAPTYSNMYSVQWIAEVLL